jgi:hypothetical protein
LGPARWVALLGVPLVPIVMSLLLEHAGAVAEGTLLRKVEQIVVDSGGDVDGGRPTWQRVPIYTLVFTPLGRARPLEMTLHADLATFDRLPPPGPLEVRYLHWLGLLTYARWTGESPFGFVRMFWEVDWVRWWTSTCAVVLLWLATGRGRDRSRGGRRKRRRTTPLARAVPWAAALPLGLWISWNLYRAFVPGPQPDSSWLQANATVGGVSRWAEKGTRHYGFVELRFVPAGAPSEVVAVDTVDARSVIGLGAGQTVQILYPRGHPREARLARASRTYAYVNQLPWVLGLAGIAGVVALLEWRRARRRARENEGGRPAGPSQVAS